MFLLSSSSYALFYVLLYQNIQIVKHTARFNKMFHRSLSPNKKAVSLGCYIISTTKIVKYFPGEHKVICGFHFLILLFFLREMQEEDYYFKF